MVKHIITPNTFTKRTRQMAIENGDYKEWVTNLQSHKHINIIRLLKRVERGPKRIARFKNLSPREITRREALFINRQAAYLTDAYIDVEIGVEKYQSMSQRTKSTIWSKSFSEVMDKLVLPKVKTQAVKNMLDSMDLYFALPENIHRKRGSKATWSKIEKIRNKIIASGIDPKQNLLNTMDKILSKRKPGENYKVKAMDVCIAASIYADILKKTQGKRWTPSYREAMEIVYSKISVDEKLVDTIVDLSKANPQKP